MSPSSFRFIRRRAGREKGFSFAAAVCLSRKRAAHAAFPSGDLPAAMPGCNGAGQLFSAAGLIVQRIRTMGSPRSARLCSAKQNSCPAPSSALLRPQAPTPRDGRAGPRGVQPVSAAGQGIAVKAAIGAADPPAERHPPWHATTAPSPSPTRQRHRSRISRHLADRASARRARALRLSPRPGRTRSAPAARTRCRAGPARQCGRGVERHADRHPARGRSRRSAVVVRQPVPPQARPHRARARQQRAGAAPRARPSRTAPRSSRSSSSA